MARIKDQQSYDKNREHLLQVGEQLLRANSYASVGINDVLKAANVPKGSFYHYFASKEAFGLAVADYYHQQQMQAARTILHNTEQPPAACLHTFFLTALDSYRARNFGDGCLMCNLSSEMAASNNAFQQQLTQQWQQLSALLAECLSATNNLPTLAHLSPDEAADWLLNSWSGALTRMKTQHNAEPLELFMKTMFPNGS